MIPQQARTSYPDLADDLEVLDRDVTPVFCEFDLAALREQHRYRRQQVFVLLGSVVGTTLATLQVALPDEQWPGVLLAILGVVLATSSRWSRERESLAAYLAARLKAERLRALYFQYLSRTGRFAGRERGLELRRAVLAVRAGKELE